MDIFTLKGRSSPEQKGHSYQEPVQSEMTAGHFGPDRWFFLALLFARVILTSVYDMGSHVDCLLLERFSFQPLLQKVLDWVKVW